MSPNSLVEVVEPSRTDCVSAIRTGNASRFDLFVEPFAATPLNRALSAGPSAIDGLALLEVPSGVSHLAPKSESLSLVARKPRSAALIFEPVEVSGRSRLLVVTSPSLRVRLNGQIAPLVALLKVGDQLQLDTLASLHVTEFRGGGAVSPRPDLIGRPCGVCRLPLTAETKVYICGGCGLPLHLEGAPKPEAERLECALFGDCPSCGSEVKTSSGHVWVPEL